MSTILGMGNMDYRYSAAHGQLEGWLSSLLKSSAYLKVILKPGIYYMGEWVPQNKRGRLKGDKGQLGFELSYTCYGLPRGEELV